MEENQYWFFQSLASLCLHCCCFYTSDLSNCLSEKPSIHMCNGMMLMSPFTSQQSVFSPQGQMSCCYEKHCFWMIAMFGLLCKDLLHDICFVRKNNNWRCTVTHLLCPGFNAWVFLYGVCIFSLCMCGFSLGTPDSSHCPKTGLLN